MSFWNRGFGAALIGFAAFCAAAWGENPTDSSTAALSPAQAAATRIVSDTKRIPDEPLREAMRTVIRQHPETARWSGTCDGTVFSVVAVEFPTDVPRMQARKGLVSRAGMFAAGELLTSRNLLAVWQKERLDDATTLKAAVLAVASRLESGGRVRFTLKKCVINDDFAVAYAAAVEKEVVTELSREEELALVKESYRETMHRQARALMEREQWDDALAFWRHLRERELVSPWLYLDAAKCFEKIGKPDESAQLAREAFDVFGNFNESAFFETVGELLLTHEDEESQRVAEAAFNRAADTLDNN